MPGFTQVFGGTTIAPANASFLSLVMATSVELAWPIEQAINGNVVADTIEVNASAPGLDIDLPDARQVSTGYTTCFNNTGPNTVTVRNAVGANLLSLISGTAWVLYLADNSTEGGTWRVFQLGASVSVAVAAALAGAGLRAITTTLNQDIPITTFNATPTTLIGTDRAKLMNWTGGLGTLNLPTPGVVGNGWYVQVRNSGSGDLTVTPPSGTIDGAATKTFASGTSAVVVTDGVDFYTLGFGSGAGGGGGSFDFIEINVAGSGDFVLSGANLNRISYRLTGILTGNRNIIVPNAIQQYWIANATTGAFSLFVKTAGQTPPGIEVLQNNQSIMYCDGSNIIDAESSTVSFPIPVVQGGTGAVNAATARTNLGAGVAGSNIFVAATQAAAQTALGISLTAVNAWSAVQQFTGVGSTASPAVQISSTFPNLQLYETDGALNNKNWHITVNSESLLFRTVDDAGAAALEWLRVERTGITIDTVNFENGVLQYGGIEVGYRNFRQRRDVSVTGNFQDSDRGGVVRFTGGAGQSINFPISTITANGIITIYNDGSAPVSITSSGGAVLAWFAGSGSLINGNRTLAVGGAITLYCIASNLGYVSGVGLT